MNSENESRNPDKLKDGVFEIGQRLVDRTGLDMYQDISKAVTEIAGNAFKDMCLDFAESSVNLNAVHAQYEDELMDVIDTWSLSVMILIMQKLSVYRNLLSLDIGTLTERNDKDHVE